ncbi:MAG TPA: hypothetical protein PLC02_08050 [Pseudomonadota bacterium]|nr:hypothetical protein [Xanthomonadales bacterium]HRA37630.1 hypothetical protein [Pseudomonadota bacterium]
MSTARKPDSLARVAQARAEAERSLAALRLQREAWGRRLQALPWWAVLLGGFVGGALAGRIVGRARPRRDTLGLLAALGPLGRVALEGVARFLAASMPAPAPPAGPRATAPAAPASAADRAPD